MVALIRLSRHHSRTVYGFLPRIWATSAGEYHSLTLRAFNEVVKYAFDAIESLEDQVEGSWFHGWFSVLWR